MKLTLRPVLALLFAILIALPASAVLAAPAQAPCLKVASASVREGPGGGYRRVGLVNKGECITVIALSPDSQWYQTPQGWVWAAPHLWSQGAAQAQPEIIGQPVTAGGQTVAGSASTGPVQAESWISDHAPDPGGEVVAYVLVRVDGVPRAGIPVNFAHQPGGVLCARTTNAEGIAACLLNVSDFPANQLIVIQTTFRALGQNYAQATSFAVGGDCDPAYPDFCLPRGQAVTCATIPYRNFLVFSPDPAGLDPDENGAGCE